MAKWLGVGIALLALLILLIGFFYPFHTILKITALNGGQVIICAEMNRGEEFVISFIHSVNKRPVYDTLRVAGDHLIIVKSRFDSFGAGMPEMSTGNMKLQFDKDGWLEWTVNQPVPEIKLFVGRVANHSLHLKGRDIVLTDLVEPGTSLSIRPYKASLHEIWKGRCLE
jgi:hypothetical protein